jgi:hypothetical protein
VLVQLGSSSVDCGTDLEGDKVPPPGVYAWFSVDGTTPVTNAQVQITVMQLGSTFVHLDSSQATVTITALSPRVQGSVLFSNVVPDEGTIAANGVFDVLRCN